MDGEIVVPIMVVATLFIALPWIVLHYITKWKTASTLTKEDENLLDELHDLARRLDERTCSIERILTAENPAWRSVACDPDTLGLQDRRVDALDPLDSLEPVTRSNRPSRRPR
jgi:phage shock protein B